MRTVTEKQVESHEKKEGAMGCLLSGIGLGLICTLVGLVAIYGLEKHDFGRPSRQAMSRFLAWLGETIGHAGGVSLIIVGVVLAVSGVLTYVFCTHGSRKKKSCE